MNYKQTKCHDCSKELGSKADDGKPKRCRPCRNKKLQDDPTSNPMFGKKHDRSKFRKNTFPNVNYDDRVMEFSPAGNSRKKYRMLCNQCGADRGYQLNIDALRVCETCRVKNRTCYSVEQRRIRCSMKANLVARLKQRLLNKNNKSTFEVLPYTVDELFKHLESQFQDGMSWNNYGEWEIDHITPDSWFAYNSIEDQGFKDSWALKNLQPLWREDNRSKGNRYEG